MTEIISDSLNQINVSLNQNQKDIQSLCAPKWAQLLLSEFKKPYMDKIREFLKTELQSGHRFFPPGNQIFNALKLCDYDDVRVVIIGQDPYHGAGQACGLCFAVNAPTPAPPSLQNIFKEMCANYEIPYEMFLKQKIVNTNLFSWATQGVLLLNTVLTVRENQALSHRGIGWESFTDAVIEHLNHKTSPVVFLCWGASAAQKVSKISNKNHVILTSPHPSPLSAHRGFLGNKHFIKTNEILQSKGLEPINWFS